MDEGKILGVLRLRASQLKCIEYPGGAALRMTEINIFLEYKVPGVMKLFLRHHAGTRSSVADLKLVNVPFLWFLL